MKERFELKDKTGLLLQSGFTPLKNKKAYINKSD
jgi:hypothetical protein